MLIKERVAKATSNDAQRQIFAEIKSLIETTLIQMQQIYIDDDINKHHRYIDVSDYFEARYRDLNQRFREVFCKKSTQITTYNLYYKTYNKMTYYNVVQESKPELKVTTVNKFYLKFDYNFQTLWALIKENLILLYAKEGSALNYLQIIVSFVKVTLDCFKLQEVNWSEVHAFFCHFHSEYDDIEIIDSVTKYGSNPVRKRKSGVKYTSKCINLDYIVRDMIDDGMKKTAICKELKISRQSLYNIMKNSILFK